MISGRRRRERPHEQQLFNEIAQVETRRTKIRLECWNLLQDCRCCRYYDYTTGVYVQPPRVCRPYYPEEFERIEATLHKLESKLEQL